MWNFSAAAAFFFFVAFFSGFAGVVSTLDTLFSMILFLKWDSLGSFAPGLGDSV
jgi:hypothetical protein